MPQIRPLSDLQDKLNDIYEVIHTTDQPMFFTRDDQYDVVIMSYDTYNRNFTNNEQTPQEKQVHLTVSVDDDEYEINDRPKEKTSEEILQEARKNLQNMVDQYSNDCEVNYPKPKKKRRR